MATVTFSLFSPLASAGWSVRNKNLFVFLPFEFEFWRQVNVVEHFVDWTTFVGFPSHFIMRPSAREQAPGPAQFSWPPVTVIEYGDRASSAGDG